MLCGMVLVVSAAQQDRVEASADAGEVLKGAAGESHYSYRIVLQQFLPALEQLDRVVRVERPEVEVPPIVEECRSRREACLHLSFAPPQLTPLTLGCRTIPVFAWEFPDIPAESWGGDPRNSWHHVFERTGCAITHSEFAARAVRRVMGDAFPILACPSPVWDDFAPATEFSTPPPACVEVGDGAFVVDSGALRGEVESAAGLTASCTLDLDELLAEDAPSATRLELDGVVYTSVFNPGDFRKNWKRMVMTFVGTFRETRDAVLVLKFVHWNHGYWLGELHELIYKLSPFQCRVVALGGYLEAMAFSALVDGTTFTLNTSTGEGQCLPMMEFMSRGKPAVSPGHTAFEDYVDDSNAFLIDGGRRETGFPQDPRGKLLTSAFEFDSDSYARALTESYEVSKRQPARYAEMGRAASERLRLHASRGVVVERLRTFLADAGALP